jgi:hypothetical protein
LVLRVDTWFAQQSRDVVVLHQNYAADTEGGFRRPLLFLAHGGAAARLLVPREDKRRCIASIATTSRLHAAGLLADS